MHDREAVLLFGNTCVGKSSLGKKVHEQRGVAYLSFGDLKRVEIARRSRVGNDLEQRIAVGQPIDSETAARLLNGVFGKARHCLVSGYPISEQEVEAFVRVCRCAVRGAVVLELGDEEIRRRYYNRVTCPVCQYPGITGEQCPIHAVPMVSRPDASEEELAARHRLYANRIEPFVHRLPMLGIPTMKLWVDRLTLEQVFKTVVGFLDATFEGGAHG